MQKEQWIGIVYRDDMGNLFSTTSRKYQQNAFADVIEVFRGSQNEVMRQTKNYIKEHECDFDIHPLEESQILELIS